MEDIYKKYLDKLAEQKTLAELAAPDDGMQEIGENFATMGMGGIDLRRSVKIPFPEMDEVILRRAAKGDKEATSVIDKFHNTADPGWRKRKYTDIDPASEALDFAEGATSKLERYRTEMKDRRENNYPMDDLKKKFLEAINTKDEALKEFREASSKPKKR